MTTAPPPPDTDALFGAPPKDLPVWSRAPASRRTEATDIEIRELDLNDRRDRRRFMQVPPGIYDRDPHYIAPLSLVLSKQLDPKKNHAFRYLDVRALQAIRNGRLVGRMTVQVDRNMEHHTGKRAGHFGFFEIIDDEAVAHALLDAGMRWLADQGCHDVLGPANFTLSHNSGLLVDNFDRPPFVEQLYNPPYYERHLLSYGFGKAKDFLVWWIDLDQGMDTPKRQRIDKIAQRIQKKEGVSFRHVDLKRAKDEIRIVHRIFTEAWEKNWGFAPVPADEFESISEEIKDIAIADLLLFVQVGGEDVGFSLTIPNVNEKMPKDGKLFPFGWTGLLSLKKTRHARLYLLGTLPQYRKRGLESIMFGETVRRCRAAGMEGGEIGWTLEDNHLINRAIESMEGRLDRTYRILGMTF
jgi:GNAT superfamily N-acetyltransferase